MTGSTGFLGTYVLERLRKKYNVEIISRSATDGVRGDLTQWNAGLGDSKPFKKKYSLFLHLAGLYDLQASSTDCFLQNVVATSHALKLSQDLGIPVFVNTSSVAAAINSKRSVVRPQDLDLLTPFPDAYSETKAQTEKMVQTWPKEGPACRINLRPGVIVGPTTGEAIQRIDGPYNGPEIFGKLRGLIEKIPGPIPLPGSASRHIPVIPVDVCADAIVKIVADALENPRTGYFSYHLAPEKGLSIPDFYATVLKNLGFQKRRVQLIRSLPQFVIQKFSEWALRFPEEELNYLLAFPRYDVNDLRPLLGEGWCPEFAEYEQAFWSGYEKYVSNR